MKILVINAGSSSVKYHLYDMPQGSVLAMGMVERIGEGQSELSHVVGNDVHVISRPIANVAEAVDLILETIVDEKVGVIDDLSQVGAVGHRCVHGGEEFTGSVLVDENVIASIEKFGDLAPLHNPPNLAGITAVQRQLPKLRQVACFDTAFHSTIPEVAYMYALPYELYEKYGIRRYGFHGISHRYVARRAATMLGKDKYDINVITCHLGNGCSITAVRDGKSVDTSMGLTPLEGVPMGTRSGDLDPGILFYLAGKGFSVDDLNSLCNKKSGLLGLSGTSNDVRNLIDLSEQGDDRAKLAIDVFCYRIKKYIGTYSAVLSRVDALVFTGGIGENAIRLRRQICTQLGQIGVELDIAANDDAVAVEARVSTDASDVAVLVIPTNEQIAIARDTYKLTAPQASAQ